MGVQTEIKGLIGRSAIYSLGTVASAAATLLLIPFYVAHLSAFDYGRYALADLVSSVLMILVVGGLNISLLARFPSGDQSKQRGLIASALVVLVLAMAAWTGLFVMLVLSRSADGILGIGLRLGLLACGVACIEALWSVLAAAERARGAASAFMFGSLAQVVGTVGATLVLVGHFGFKGEGILLGRLVGGAMAAAPCLARHAWQGLVPERAMIKRLGSDSPSLILAALSTTVLMSGPRALINVWATPTEVGIFAMSARIAGAMNVVLVQPFSLAWIPNIRSLPKDGIGRRISGEVVAVYAVVAAMLVCVASILSPWAVAVLRRPEFPFDSRLLFAMCVVNSLSGLTHALNVGPYLCDRPTAQVPAFLVSTLAAVVTCTIGMRFMGLIGLALGLVGAYVVQVVLVRRISQRLFPFSIDYSRLGMYLLAVLLAYLVSARARGVTPILTSAAGGVASFVVLLIPCLWVAGFWKRVGRLLGPGEEVNETRG